MTELVQNSLHTNSGILNSFDATRILNAPFTVILENSAKILIGGEILIPDPDGLLKAVAQSRALHPQKLNGSDIRFLRGCLEMKAKEFAKVFGLSPEHVSRLESGDKVLSSQTEMLIRVFTVAVTVPDTIKKDFNGKKIAELVANMVKDMDVSPVRMASEKLVFRFFRKMKNFPVGESLASSNDNGIWDQPSDVPIAA